MLIDKVSIAIPTRDRRKHIEDLLRSYVSTTQENDRPTINFVLDKCYTDYALFIGDKCGQLNIPHNLVYFPIRSSLTQLWNYGMIKAGTHWVLTVGDDVEFQDGWAEFLESKIESSKFWQINLHAYSAFCMHREFILQLGWHDERHRGGGFEDIDWQLRISERGLKHMVCMDKDCVYVKHNRSKYGGMERWQNYNNPHWMCEKWGRPSWWDYRIPSFRKCPEIDWHPLETSMLEKEYEHESLVHVTNALVGSGNEVYP